MHYFIDGYNLLFRLPQRKERSLEKQRESLIEVLDTELAHIKGHVSVIFDSSEQIRDFAQCAKKNNLEVIYAPKGKTADEYIIELVEQRKNPKILIVVTSDGGLARQCKHLGSQTKTIEDFLEFVANKSKGKSEGKPHYRESPSEMERLIKIFEERLESD